MSWRISDRNQYDDPNLLVAWTIWAPYCCGAAGPGWGSQDAERFAMGDAWGEGGSPGGFCGGRASSGAGGPLHSANRCYGEGFWLGARLPS